MGFFIDDEGRIHRDEIRERIFEPITRVERSYYDSAMYTGDDFTFGFALLGLIAGGAVGFLISVAVRFFLLVFANDANLGALESVFADGSFSTLFITVPVIVVTVIAALAGFFLDGFEATREAFSPMCGALGFLALGIIGVAAAIITAIVREMNEAPEIATLKIMFFIVLISAILGFVWNAIQGTREFFSLHRSLLGFFCGLIKSIAINFTLLFSFGCFTIILAAVFSPVALGIMSLISLFYSFKGFIAFGLGYEWDDL
jgi:hypothetical protein